MKKNITSFSAVVQLPEEWDNEEVTVDVELCKDEEHLTYDEVEDAILSKVDDIWHCMPDINNDDCLEDDSLWPSIIDIVINADDGESYPVISESMDDSKLKKDQAFTKYLVLPDAIYGLTPECKLWMELKETGILPKDTPFDFAKFHKMVEKADK